MHGDGIVLLFWNMIGFLLLAPKHLMHSFALQKIVVNVYFCLFRNGSRNI